MKMQAQLETIQTQPGDAKSASSCQTLEEEGKASPAEPWEGPWLPMPWSQALGLQHHEKIHSKFSSHSLMQQLQEASRGDCVAPEKPPQWSLAMYSPRGSAWGCFLQGTASRA